MSDFRKQRECAMLTHPCILNTLDAIEVCRLQAYPLFFLFLFQDIDYAVVLTYIHNLCFVSKNVFFHLNFLIFYSQENKCI